VIINIYKEKNWTSFDVVAKVRSIFKIKKVGHAGTLDPLAEGVLIVLTDKDTKKQNEFMLKEKEYKATIGFGIQSPTYDMEGPVSIKDISFSVEELEICLQKHIGKYIGTFEQTVPPYSAVKVKGHRLYNKARKGDVQRESLPKKKITIYSIENISFDQETLNIEEKDVTIPVMSCTITCSSGTYIRSLAHDLGEDIGVGGVLVKLVRTRIGEYTSEGSIKVGELETP